MDASEATKVVMSRIKGLDPENASRIMGCILIQDQGEKEMIRLAFGPESLLLSHINQARACLGLSPCSTSTSNPMMMKVPNSPHPCRTSSPRVVLVPKNNGFLSSPSSPAFQTQQPFTYAAAVNGNSNGSNAGGGNSTSSGNTCGSPRLHFYSGRHTPVQEQLSFTDEMNPTVSPGGRSDSVGYPYGGEDLTSIPSPQPHPFHRRSSSVNDVAFLASLDEGGNGNGNHGLLWRPCVYFARGFCKNGSTCKFLHSDGGLGEGIELGSPNKGASGFDDLLRMRAIQSQRFSLMTSGGHHPLENLRHDFSPISGASSSSRQIYLTFPADSTFKEEDVSNYFSTYGPVQDVRIPHQQKRMFGFVTFVYAETVKLILAKGNPHFVCDSRVLVKPYKEKGKIPDKKPLHQQHLERGEYSRCSSPTGADSREHIDHPIAIGSRMLYSPQEMMLRRKMEASELQHAIDLQSWRMMNLRLVDLKIQHRNNHFLPRLGAGIPISSPRQSPSMMNHNITTSFDVFSSEDSEGFDDNHEAAKYPGPVDQMPVLEEIEVSSDNNASSNKLQHGNGNDSHLPESLEHVLPDNLFASPTKSAAEHHSAFSQASADDTTPLANPSSNNNDVVLPSNSLRAASFNLYYNQLPRFSSGQEAVEM